MVHMLNEAVYQHRHPKKSFLRMSPCGSQHQRSREALLHTALRWSCMFTDTTSPTLELHPGHDSCHHHSLPVSVKSFAEVWFSQWMPANGARVMLFEPGIETLLMEDMANARL